MVQAPKMPTYNEMLWPTLQALKNTDGSASNQEMLPKVIQIMGLPEEVQDAPHGAGPRTEVEYRLFWARYYLRKVGAIESSERGISSITPSGRALTESDVQSIPSQVRGILRNSRPKSDHDQETPEGEGIDESWQDQLILILQAMPPDALSA
jgi:restriction system protein